MNPVTNYPKDQAMRETITFQVSSFHIENGDVHAKTKTNQVHVLKNYQPVDGRPYGVAIGDFVTVDYIGGFIQETWYNESL